MHKGARYWLLIAGVFIGAFSAAAKLALEPALNPKSYQSVSGEYVWEVDPTNMYGQGDGYYRLKQKGVVRWEGKKPFTLYEAAVSAQGALAGYAYTHGREGTGRNEGDFRVVIIQPDGQLLLDETVKREASRFLHTLPNPLADGLWLNDVSDRFAVRVEPSDANRRAQSWWLYELSSGKSVGKMELPYGDSGYLMKAEAVAGTPFVLVQHWVYKDPNVGTRFALMHAHLREIWSIEWPRDYSAGRNEEARDALWRVVRQHGAILSTKTTNQFEIWSAASGERVRFGVQLQGGQWEVREIGREKHAGPGQEAAVANQVAERPLKLLGSFEIQSGGGEPVAAIREVSTFDFDSRGRIGFIRQDSLTQDSFVLVSPEGKVEREMELKIPAEVSKDARLNAVWLKEDRWLVTASDYKVGGKAQAWWLHVGEGTFKPIPGFDSPPMENVRGTSNGGFVALAVIRHKYSMEDELIAFDAEGRVRWRIKEDGRGSDQSLFSPEDIAVTAAGEIAVLDNIRNVVQFFDDKGTFLRRVSLQASWRREPNYPSAIVADKNGGILVYDFNGHPPIVRMNANGQAVSQFSVKYADGRIIDGIGQIKVSPAGRVWLSDGDCLIRVTDHGVADLILGQGPSEEKLGRISKATVDREGRLYAVDERTGAVHVFDEQGKALRICRPDKGDFSGILVMADLAVGPDGATYVSSADAMLNSGNHQYVHFAPSGQRLEKLEFALDGISEEWHALPDGLRFLVLGYEKAFLTDAKGKVIRTIERRPDGQWLKRPDSASVAGDGSFAIATSGDRGAAAGIEASIYAANGDPIRTVALPKECKENAFVFTGQHLVSCTDSAVVVLDEQGKVLFKFTPAIEGFKEIYWSAFASRGGKELWLVSQERKRVWRYALE